MPNFPKKENKSCSGKSGTLSIQDQSCSGISGKPCQPDQSCSGKSGKPHILIVSAQANQAIRQTKEICENSIINCILIPKIHKSHVNIRGYYSSFFVQTTDIEVLVVACFNLFISLNNNPKPPTFTLKLKMQPDKLNL